MWRIILTLAKGAGSFGALPKSTRTACNSSPDIETRIADMTDPNNAGSLDGRDKLVEALEQAFVTSISEGHPDAIERGEHLKGGCDE